MAENIFECIKGMLHFYEYLIDNLAKRIISHDHQNGRQSMYDQVQFDLMIIFSN